MFVGRTRRRAGAAVAAAATLALTVGTTACTDQAADGGGNGGADTVFTTIDATHKIDPKAPINPYNAGSNAAVGYNAMQLAWAKNVTTDDPKAFYPGIAASWEAAADQSSITVNIQPNAKWSDGKPVTAQDVKTSAAIAFTQGAGAFSTNPGASGGLGAVKVLGDKKIEFDQVAGGKNNTFVRGILTLYVVPDSVFGSQLPKNVWDLIGTATSTKSGAKAQAAAAAKLTAAGKKVIAYGPEKDVSAGPFVLQRVDPSQAVLKKNKYYWNAKNIGPSTVVLKNYSGNEQIWSYVIGGKLDAAPYTSTPTNVVQKMLKTKGNQKVTGFSPVAASLAFNQSVAPLGNVHVRRGLAYAIDRAQVTKIGEPESGTASTATSGLIAAQGKAELGSVGDKLDDYAPDKAKAAAEFKQAGLKQKGGKWYLPNGKRWTLDLQVPSGFTDWIAGTQNISRQLTAQGIDTKVQTTADYPTYLAEIAEGKYTAGFWLVALGPSNFNAYARLYGASNGWVTTGNQVKHTTGKGSGNWMNGAETASVPGLGKVNPGELTYDLSQQPVDQQGATVQKLAQYTSDQLPVIQLWDYTNVQFVNTTRFTNFPKSNADVLRLSPGVWMQLGYIKAAG